MFTEIYPTPNRQTVQTPANGHVANSSFMLGMVASIADKLTAMKQERDAVINGTGRDLVVLKASVVDAGLEKLDLKLRTCNAQREWCRRRPTKSARPRARHWQSIRELAGLELNR
jgi:hypothetical protein